MREGVPLAGVAKIDRRLKRLASLEASYRRSLKMAQEDLEAGKMSQGHYGKVERRCRARIDRLADKIRQLRAKRAHLAGQRGVGKGI